MFRFPSKSPKHSNLQSASSLSLSHSLNWIHRGLVVAAFVAVFLTNLAEGRTWVDSTGNPIEADFIGLKASKVALRLEDGKAVEMPLKALSKVDQEYVLKHSFAAKAELVALAAKRIDAAVEKGLDEKKLQYNEGLNDHMFLRRIYLDLAGRIPSYQEARDFLASRKPMKRQELLTKLLNSVDYTSHNYNYFAEQLRIQSRFPGTVLRNDAFIFWLKKQIQTNRPYDELVRELITAEGHIWDNPAVGYHFRDKDMKLDHVAFMGKVFLGTDITCAQCHDDPFSNWTQYEYYELSAYLSNLDTKGPKPKNKAIPNRKQIEQHLVQKNGLDPKNAGDKEKLRNLVRRYDRPLRDINRAGEFMVRAVSDRPMRLPATYEYDDAVPNEVVPPRVLFGKEQGAAVAALTSRERLAAWLTSRNNKRFAMNIANRMWAKYMGRGVSEPLYNIDPRKAYNPELLKVLAEEMLVLDFDLKAFSWVIVNTKAYNRLASRTKSAEAEPYHFPGPILRRMTAEQVWDSMMTLMLGDPNQFQLESGEEFNELIDLAGQSSPSVEEFLSRIERYDKFRPEHLLVNEEGISILNAKLTPKKSGAFGTNLTRPPFKKDGMSDEVAMMELMNVAKKKKILLARASELPQPSDPAHFLSQFGQSQRTFVIRASSLEGSVPQVMELMNGYTTEILTQPGSKIFLDMKNLRSNFEKANVVFMSILSRRAIGNEHH
ncbi:DUF1549 domain-containing protein, partial [Akkermansiaceae bacterium]|nr:DUF1549 domain-containing protein [Akkermansiaceae bacterium]